MPPRFAYWTILIDHAPTAFRARNAEELLPTLNQLKRTNRDVVMKWFSGGKLWESPRAAQEARRRPKPTETRGADWRPGGQHKDPRAKYAKKNVRARFAKKDSRQRSDQKEARGRFANTRPRPPFRRRRRRDDEPDRG
jgi:hypothetical protein